MGCSQFQRFGFNQLDYLGVADVGGASCDWNGGARASGSMPITMAQETTVVKVGVPIPRFAHPTAR